MGGEEEEDVSCARKKFLRLELETRRDEGEI